jgi:transposase-like protein
MFCPKCGSDQIRKEGSDKGVQRFKCKICGRKFNENTALSSPDELNKDPEVIIVKEKPEPAINHNSKELGSMAFEERENTATGSIITAEKPGTKEDAAKLFKVDLSIWEPERMVINSWDVTMKLGSGDSKYPKTETNYQVKVWFRLRKNEPTIEELSKIFQDLTKNYKPQNIKTIRRRKIDSSYMLELSIADLHLGKLAWHQETGENYDIKIARKRFMYCLNDLLDKSLSYDPKKILFVIGNDYFNADNPENMTAKGTVQDCDVRWQKRYMSGCKLMVDAVEVLRSICPVDIVVIPGNHDKQTSFYLGEWLSAWYKECKDVSINNCPLERKYYVWGNSLIGLTHGEKIKYNELPLIMATEVPELWSKTVFREIHTGHWHREIAHDIKGITVRSLKSPTGTDSWHYGKGFIGSIKGAEAFIWHNKYGLEGHLHSNLIS